MSIINYKESTLKSWRTERLAGYYMSMASLTASPRLSKNERELARSQLEITIQILATRPAGEKYGAAVEMTRQLNKAHEDRDVSQLDLYINMLSRYMRAE